MGLGDLVGGAIDSALGTQSTGSNLQGFLSRFSSSEALYVNQIDPLNTFDVNFKFFPGLENSSDKQKKGFFDKVCDSAISYGKNALQNGLNNVTGGLFGAFMNGGVVTDLQEAFIAKSKGETTFLDYIIRGNMLTKSDGILGGKSDEIQKPNVELDLSYFVQDMSLPQISTKDGESIETLIGDFPINGKFVKPSSNEFSMTIINTKAPLGERIFYPWMREVTLPVWTYEKQPYTTADVTVSFDKHMDMQYVFVNCRPKEIESMKPTNELQSPIRSVTFIFDYMFITSKLESSESAGSKIKGAASSIVKGAINSIF